MKKTLFFVILLLSFIGLTAEQIVVSQYPDDIRLTNSNPNNMELEFTLGSFYREPVTINGDSWYHLFLKKEGTYLRSRNAASSCFSKKFNYSLLQQKCI